MRIPLVFDGGVYVCICKVYSGVSKEYTSHAFVYDSDFSQLEKSECCGSIIDNRSYVTIFVLEDKDIRGENALNNMLMNWFKGICIVEYVVKVAANDF